MYLAKQLTTRSYPDIGRRFGGRDHTTVLHAVKQMEKLKAENATLAADLDALTPQAAGLSQGDRHGSVAYAGVDSQRARSPHGRHDHDRC